MTREAEMKARDFVALIISGIHAETEVGVAQRRPVRSGQEGALLGIAGLRGAGGGARRGASLRPRLLGRRGQRFAGGCGFGDGLRRRPRASRRGVGGTGLEQLGHEALPSSVQTLGVMVGSSEAEDIVYTTVSRSP